MEDLKCLNKNKETKSNSIYCYMYFLFMYAFTVSRLNEKDMLKGQLFSFLAEMQHYAVFSEKSDS